MCRLLVIASLALLTQAGMAQNLKTQHKPRLLSDAAMDRVTAAGVTASFSGGVVQFQGSVPTVNGLVTGAGTLQVLSGPITGGNTSTLTLNGGAQQHFSSLVNISSSVGPLTQTNLTGKH